MSFHLVLFLAFGAVCVGGAINLLAQRHPINSALSLITVMAALAGEYLLLGAEFLAAVQVIVYAGAIMVLFVFVIMLLNAGEEDQRKPRCDRDRRTGNAHRQLAVGMGRAPAFGNRGGCDRSFARASNGHCAASIS
jgi:hypothetical protein